MGRKLNSKYPLVHDQEEQDPCTPPENAPDSPVSGDDTRAATPAAPSPKKIKRGAQKRVVSVPIGDVDGSRSKGEGYPTTDSWAWRKYGQKPIKGSPYPRGYYRCSSSKGCPARKQVERSRVDPTTMVITYAFDHNHPVPPTKHHHHHLYSSFSAVVPAAAGVVTSPQSPPADDHLPVFTNQVADEKYPELGCGDPLSLAAAADFCWFSDVVSPTILESTVLGPSYHVDAEMAGVYTMGTEEDESLFADLGELPECSVVFRQSFHELNDTAQRCSLAASLCGSTG